MPTITSILTINGSVVNRAAHRVTIERVRFGIEGPHTLDFTQEVVGSLQGSYTEGESASLALTDGTTTVTVFQGVIVSHTTPNIGAGVINCGYHCEDMRFLALKTFSTTAANGTGTIIYDMPRTDPNWAQNLTGLPVGTILADYFSQHSSQLTALGISQPPAGDLTPLTYVPSNTVVLNGPIFDAVDGLLRTWGYSNKACYIDPNTLQIRVVDTTALTATTLTMGTDPIQVQDLTTDISNCFTRVVARGGDETMAAIIALSTETLVQNWTSGQQASWTINAYANPSNQVTGTITSMTTSTVTCNAFAGQVTTWGTNYWDEAQIWVQLGFGPGGGSGVQESETAEVISCTATSGGSATFTVDNPFTSTSFTTVEIRGLPQGESLVWRSYGISNNVQRPSDGAPINLHLVQYLNGSVPFNTTSMSAVETTGPAAEVYFSTGCTGTQQVWFATLQVLPSPDGVTPGTILFTEPTVSEFSSPHSLVVGTPDGVPCDIKVLVPFSNGALSAPSPSSGYAGTAYSTYGVEWTLYRDYPSWQSNLQNSPANMAILSSNIAASTQNSVLSGRCVYHGVPLALMTLGQSLNITGQLFTGTAYAGMASAIRNITVQWPDYGGTYQVTHLQFTNQRMAYTGDSLFLHPLTNRPPGGNDFTVGGGISYGAAKMTLANEGGAAQSGAWDGLSQPGGEAGVPLANLQVGGGQEESGFSGTGGGATGDGGPSSPYQKPSQRREARKRSLLEQQATEGKRAFQRGQQGAARQKARHARNQKRDDRGLQSQIDAMAKYTTEDVGGGGGSDPAAIQKDQNENARRSIARRDRQLSASRKKMGRGPSPEQERSAPDQTEVGG